MKHSRPRGFTLIEILVVLVITGFVVAILLQALHQVFRLQTLFGSEIFDTQRGAMYTGWFRQSINGLMPDFPDGKQKFTGEPRTMSGLTLFPLNESTGTPVSFVWRLEFNSRTGETGLYFDGGGQQVSAQPILVWQGNDARFIYIDAKSEPHESWPPFLGEWPQLPDAIYLQSGTPQQSRLIVGATQGPQTPLARRKDIEAL